MKVVCKCGNIEEIISDKAIERFEFKNFEDGTAVLICKSCNEVVFISLKV